MLLLSLLLLLLLLFLGHVDLGRFHFLANNIEAEAA